MSAPHDTASTAARPIFSADAVSGYGERLVRAAEAIARLLAAGAPELVSVAVAEHLVYITPWQPGSPLSGLLTWSRHLADAVWEAKPYPPLHPGGQVATSLFVRGRLAGLEVEITGYTWQPVQGVNPAVSERQPVEAAEVLHLVEQEAAAL